MSDTKDAEQLLFEAGLARRREVLGDEWVDATIEARTEFNAEFQEMITRTAWHEIWNRDGLDQKTRRLLTLSVTAALGRWEEFRLHATSALQSGSVNQKELAESLMQLGVYAGVPAANTAFREAQKIITELSDT